MRTGRDRNGVVMLIALWVLAGTGAAETTIQTVVVPGTVRVRPEGAVSGADEAQLAAARGEYESFQVVITARDGSLESVEAEMDPLTNEASDTLPSDSATLYRAIQVPIRHSAPRATVAPGWLPDPLIPFKDPYTGEAIRDPRWTGKELEAGRRFGASGFSVWEGRNEVLWIDVWVPRDAAPGTYTGSLTVRAANVKPVEIPVRVEVWDLLLPEGPTHENHFGGVDRVARYLGLDASSDAFQPIEDRYMAMMADHRINPPLPRRLHPARNDDGSAVFDDELDAKITEWHERYHVTNVDVPRAPFPDVLGVDRDKAKRYYASWYAYLERKGWTKGAYLYMLDEPNDPEDYERVRQLGAMVHEGAPGLRRLVVEQPYVQNPDWGTLDDAIDIWCPLFGFIHEPSVQRVQANGDEVWSYSALVQSTPPYNPDYKNVKDENPPYWQIDFPVTSYRIAPWLNRRYGITGLLYWSAVYWGSPDRNPWYDPGFRVRWNGDGFLFYPGDAAGIDGPIASIRLKNLRDGMEDYELLAMLDQRDDGKAITDKIVQTAVPTWGTWNQDPNQFTQLRQQLAKEILKRGK